MTEQTSKSTDCMREAEQLDKWQESKLFERIRAKNKGNKSFYFLQGPPYTSGRLHTGHAWNHALKDMVIRYKRMQGLDVFDRAGYDMHGLPTETKVMAKLGLKDKDAIAEFGFEKFTKECIAFSVENAKIMNDDLRRLGVDMDFENAYLPVTKEYINGIWWLIKTLHEKGRLYEGFRTVYWDWTDETALTKHELEYKTVTDKSIFVKFPVVGEENTFLIIWTTTPWTIPLNLAVMVNPELEYNYCTVEGDSGTKERWVVAKALSAPFIQSVVGQQLSVEKTVMGSELAGVKYVHPFEKQMGPYYDELRNDEKAAKALHTVLLSEDHVDTSAGTGLVHCAPGCGPEDFEVGWRNGLPAFNIVDEKGQFPEKIVDFGGRSAIPDNKLFIEDLKQTGNLVAQTEVEHEYPHAERSGQPIIFRATKQWFWKVEDLKQRMIEENNKVTWVPQSAYNAFNSWLENLRDNSITKQRPWGTPVPIWRNTDDEQDIIVVGSVEELEELSGQQLEDPHKPFIDEITITKDGKTYKRMPDVLDVWIDAGSASWNALDFPRDVEQFEKLFPADFICEGNDQIRGWFNLLMVASIASFDKPAFKAVYMHGMLTDVDGVKMSKSLGNIISPYELVDKYSADTLRYYFTKTKAGENISFSWDEIELHHRNLRVLANTTRLFTQTIKTTYASNESVELKQTPDLSLTQLDNYMLSRLHSTIKQVTEAFEKYELYKVGDLVESLFLDVSRVYIQGVRDDLHSEPSRKQVVLSVLWELLHSTFTLFAPVAPFITDELYVSCKQTLEEHSVNLPKDLQVTEDAVHLLSFPKVNESNIHEQLEIDFRRAQVVISDILSTREKMQRSVRYPVSLATAISSQQDVRESYARMAEYIAAATNTKQIVVAENHDAITYAFKANFRNLAKKFGQRTADVGKQVATISQEQYLALLAEKQLALDDETTINPEDLEVLITFKDGFKGTNTVVVDEVFTEDMKREGLVREAMRRIQDFRKTLGLDRSDSVTLSIMASEAMYKAIEQEKALIEQKCSCVFDLTQQDVDEILAKKDSVKADDDVAEVYSVKEDALYIQKK